MSSTSSFFLLPKTEIGKDNVALRLFVVRTGKPFVGIRANRKEFFAREKGYLKRLGY